jgi:hypothetical protein
MNIVPSKYMNISDFIIKMSLAPEQVREGLTTQELRNTYEVKVRHSISNMIERYIDKYDDFEARFTEYERAGRKVTFMSMFIALFMRNFVYLLRNPRT